MIICRKNLPKCWTTPSVGWIPITVKTAAGYLLIPVLLILLLPVSPWAWQGGDDQQLTNPIFTADVLAVAGLACDAKINPSLQDGDSNRLNKPRFTEDVQAAAGLAFNPESAPLRQGSGAYLLKNPHFVQDAQAAVELVYNLEFTRARHRMSAWMNSFPGHPAWPFWEALELWWTILPDLENTANDALFIRKLEEADQKSDRLLRQDRRNVDALVIKSLANGFLARLYSNREGWYKSLSHARVSLNVLFRLEQLEPELHDLQFGMGTYNYFAAYLVEEYPLVRPLAWMLPGGDRTDGLNRLKVAADSSAFLIPESSYFLGHINLHYEKEYDTALYYLEMMAKRYPANGFFRRLLVRASLNMGNLTRAAELIDSTLADAAFSTDLPMLEELNAVRARIAFIYSENEQALELSEAARGYSAQLSRTPNQRRFGAMGTYYAARAKLRMGQEDEARRYLRDLNHRRNYSFYAERAREMLRSL